MKLKIVCPLRDRAPELIPTGFTHLTVGVSSG